MKLLILCAMTFIPWLLGQRNGECYIDKCGVMHFGYNNKKIQMFLGGRKLKELSIERDLGILMQDDLKLISSVVKLPINRTVF